MNKLKDILHFYIGQEIEYFCYFTNKYQIGKLEQAGKSHYFFVEGDHNGQEVEKSKLLLRHISAMTQDEMKELYFLVFKRKFVGDNITHRDVGKKEERWCLWSGLERLFIYHDGDCGADIDLQHYRVDQPMVTVWQLSKGFDLFRLIPNGLAIDKTKNESSNSK